MILVSRIIFGCGAVAMLSVVLCGVCHVYKRVACLDPRLVLPIFFSLAQGLLKIFI